MTALTRDITTEPTDDGNLLKRWTVSSPAGAVALTVIRTNHPTAEPPAPARHLIASDDVGAYVLCGFAFHQPATVPDPVFGCPVHAGCDGPAVGSELSRRAWGEIVAAGVTDDVIWRELEAIHRDQWPGGESA